MSSTGVRNEIFNSEDIKEHKNIIDDLEWEIPVESAPLPSSGLIYEKDSSLYMRDTLDIKAMTAREEDIINSRALIRNGTAISQLIRSCLVDKNIDTESLLLGDRNSLMISIRITGYGSNYDASVTCPECDHKNEETFNLSNLKIKKLEIIPVKEGKNLFEFTLPVTKKRVLFRFLTARDELDMSRASERKKKSMPGLQFDTTVTDRLVRHIVSIDNVTDRSKIASFVKRMPAFDSSSLRGHINKNEPDIDMSSELTCSSCGAKSDISLPIGINFFWPST